MPAAPNGSNNSIVSSWDQCQWHQHGGPPACYSLRLAACPIPPAWLWCSCVPQGENKKQKIKNEISLVRIICLFLLWDLSTMNPPRIRVWSWMGFVLQTVTGPLQIYVENKALLNFPRFTLEILCAWELCLRLWRRRNTAKRRIRLYTYKVTALIKGTQMGNGPGALGEEEEGKRREEH